MGPGTPIALENCQAIKAMHQTRHKSTYNDVFQTSAIRRQQSSSDALEDNVLVNRRTGLDNKVVSAVQKTYLPFLHSTYVAMTLKATNSTRTMSKQKPSSFHSTLCVMRRLFCKAAP